MVKLEWALEILKKNSTSDYKVDLNSKDNLSISFAVSRLEQAINNGEMTYEEIAKKLENKDGTV